MNKRKAESKEAVMKHFGKSGRIRAAAMLLSGVMLFSSGGQAFASQGLAEDYVTASAEEAEGLMLPDDNGAAAVFSGTGWEEQGRIFLSEADGDEEAQPAEAQSVEASPSAAVEAAPEEAETLSAEASPAVTEALPEEETAVFDTTESVDVATSSDELPEETDAELDDTTYILRCKNKGYQTLGNRIEAADQTALVNEIRTNTEDYLEVSLFSQDHSKATILLGLYADDSYSDASLIWRGARSGKGWSNEEFGTAVLRENRIYARFVARYVITLDLADADATITTVSSGDASFSAGVVTEPKTDTTRGNIRYMMTLDTEDETAKTFPTPSCVGYGFKGWLNGTKTEQTTRIIPSQIVNMTLTAQWAVASRVEFYLGEAEFSDQATYQSGYLSTPGELSKLKRYEDRPVDGVIYVANGTAVGKGFSTVTRGSFELPPSLDPVASDSYHAIFRGWRVSSSPEVLYSSDALSKLVVNGPMYVWAEWDTDDVVHITFESDGETKSLEDSHRRETERSEFVYNAKQRKDLRDQFINKNGWIVYAVPEDETMVFAGWQVEGSLAETGWYYDTDEVTLVPRWTTSKSTVIGVRFTGVKIGNKTDTTHEIYPTVGTKVTMTAATLGGSTTDITWSVYDVDDEGYETPAAKENVISLLANKNGTENSFIAKKTGTVIVEIRAAVGDFNVRDRLIVHVRPGTKSIYLNKKKYVVPKDGEATEEEQTDAAVECKLQDQSYGDMKIHEIWYASLLPVQESQLTERIYVSSTRGFYVEDDFFRIAGVQLDPATDRWYLETDKKRAVTIDILIPSNDETNLEDFQKKAHAGTTTLTFTTENGSLKRTMKLTVAGYDEDSRRFYKPDGTYIKNAVQRIHGGEYSVLPEGDDRDCYFDINGLGHIDETGNTGGLIRRYDGNWILIDNLTIDNKRRYKWVNGPEYPGTVKAQEYKYPYGGDEEAARYFVDAAGVVKSGWQTFQQESRTKTKYYDAKDEISPFQPKVSAWVETSKKRFYVDEEGCRVEGKREIGENWYCFNSNVAGMKDEKGRPIAGTPGVPRIDDKKPGEMLTGWVAENGQAYVWWYDPDTGIRAPTDAVVEDNKKLYFNSAKIGKVMPVKAGWLVYNEDMAYTVEDYPDGLVVTGVNDYYIVDKTTGELARNRLITPLTGCSWYFDDDGHTVRGPRKVGGKQYYFDPNNNNMAATRTEDIKGFHIRNSDGSRGEAISYHQDPSDGKTNQKWTYEGTSLVVDKEWAQAYLYTEDEVGDEVLLPKYYYILKGKMVTGWKTINKKKYFFGDDCALVTATAPSMPDDVADILAKRLNKTTAWVKNHRMDYYSDMVTINKKKYYLSGTGELLKNRWVHPWAVDDGPDGAVYYAGANGIAVTGKKTIKVDGVRRVFFFHANTAQKFETDLVRVGKTLYMLDSSEGYAVIKPDAAGWEGDLYVNKNGTVKTGWVTAKGDDGLKHTWYFTKEGEMLTGVDTDKRIDGKTIYGFGSDGIRLKKEWDDGEDYWFDANGKAVTGRRKILGLWYIFRDKDDEKDENLKKGMCYKDCYVKLKDHIYHLDSDGVELPIGQTQIVQAIDGNEYFVNAKGVIQKGIKTDTGSRNAGFYDKNGVRGKDGFYEVSGGWVYADENGALQTDVYATVRTVGDREDSGNLRYKRNPKNNLVITEFMDDKNQPLRNALITVNNDETRQYIIDKDGRVAIGWYVYRNTKASTAKEDGRKYKYYIAPGGRLWNTQAAHLAEIQKDNNPLLKVEGQYFYQTADGVIMALNGDGNAGDIRPAMIDEDTETGYYVNIAGVVQFSTKLKVVERTVFVDADGFRANGWCFADKEWYYVEDGEPQSTRILDAASLGDMTFVNTSTGDEFDATCETGFAGYQTEVWKSVVEKNGKLVREPITGTWESKEANDKGQIIVYTFVKGVMKTGKVQVFDSVSHAKVNRNFNSYTGRATYRVYGG